jgi:hypothetical protein
MDARKTYNNPAVGYDDVIPQTALGKALTMITSILDIGLFVLPAGILLPFWRVLDEAQEGP